jgi:hypothetical protein
MKRNIIVVSFAAALCGLAVAGCGSGLSSSSTCHDYLNASASDQQAIAEKLAGQYDKPDYATPLGEPEVAYYCAANPSTTLGQFFAKAQD